ncbi:MAG: AI-2E family transporter, partial [Eubacterium sp.]|nr:AI-2E family transporter [Eubacterium sp.]
IGIITFVAMLAFGFPYPVLLSVIVCITNMIPYFGPIIGGIPGCAIYLFIDPMLAVWFALLILCVQQFDGWILGPWILGDQTGIKPLAVILGITVGGAYFGVLGMFLGVPTVAVLQYLGGEWIKNRYKKRGLKDPKEKWDKREEKAAISESADNSQG